MAFTRPQLEQYAEEQKDRFEQLLKDFVEIPSVSADPEHKADLERCAELGLATVRAFGGRADIHRVPDGASGRARLVRVGQGPADRDRLQPPRRRAGLEEDRALADGALHVHAEGRHVLRPGHDRRQGARALGALRSPRRDRGRRAGEHQGALGARGGGRLTQLRRRRCGRSAPPPLPTRWSSPTPCGCREARPALSAGCADCSR